MKYVLLCLILTLFLISCSFQQADSSEDIRTKLEKCIYSGKWAQNIYPEVCFYEVMDDSNPEEGLDACTKLEKAGEYDYRSTCFNVLVQKFKSEELLSKIVQKCEEHAPVCKNDVLGFYGDAEKCEVLKKDFNITTGGKTVFSFYDNCVDLTKQADERKKIWEAILLKNTQLCQDLTPISRNICLFYIAEEKNNANICNEITDISESDFTYQNYCKCKIENSSEPTVICIDIGNIFDPERNEGCTVKKGQKIIAKETPKHRDVEDFRMKYAPCDTSWRYGDERSIYDESIFWAY